MQGFRPHKEPKFVLQVTGSGWHQEWWRLPMQLRQWLFPQNTDQTKNQQDMEQSAESQMVLERQ
jgi:hypothetical protein